MSSLSRVLLVAIDGMDSELIEKYKCENLLGMEEYGGIDNSTGIFRIWTSELFASLITGENYEVHGVKGLAYWKNSKIEKLEKFFEKYHFFRKFNGLRKSFYKKLGFGLRGYTKDDYDIPTLFEKIPNSRSIDVPGYDIAFSKGGELIGNYGIEGAIRQQDYIAEKKKGDLLDAIDVDYDFLMAHFHKIDHYHHWFWEMGEEEPVEEVYKEFDSLAAEILERAEGKFDYVIFMSDHGLPTPEQHNENAFYSCNRELFDDKKPKITDFHDRIIEIVGKQKQDNTNESSGDSSNLSREQEKQVKKNLEEMGYI